jgi:hypothetical protein
MTTRWARGLWGKKSLTAAFAVLCAAAALVILSLASPVDSKPSLAAGEAPASLEPGHLER